MKKTDDMIFELDAVSRLVTCDARIRWADLERHLNKKGYTLGYYNPRYAQVTLRDGLFRNVPNLFYRQYGHLADMCVSLSLKGHDEKVYHTKTIPRSAAGPDFRRLLMGLGKRLGVLDEVTVRIHAVPERVVWYWSYWPSAARAMSLVDELTAIHVTPSFAQVYTLGEQPRALQCDGLFLLSLRFAGLASMLRCYRERASFLTGQLGGITARFSRRRLEPMLEKLMNEGAS